MEAILDPMISQHYFWTMKKLSNCSRHHVATLKVDPTLGVLWRVLIYSVGSIKSQLLVSLTTIVDDSGGGVTGVTALDPFFTATMYGCVCVGAVVSGMGDVNYGRFGLLKVWGNKGICFRVEGGLNSFRIITSYIVF